MCERTTIRAVAAEADIDPAMVKRYFGSKEGLFARATTFDLELPAPLIGTAPRARPPASAPLHRSRGPPVRRRQPGDPPARGRDQRRRRRSRPRDLRHPGPPDHRGSGHRRRPTRAVLIASRLLGFAYGRHVLRIPALMSLDDEIIVSNLARRIQRCLDAPIGAD